MVGRDWKTSREDVVIAHAGVIFFKTTTTDVDRYSDLDFARQRHHTRELKARGCVRRVGFDMQSVGICRSPNRGRDSDNQEIVVGASGETSLPFHRIFWRAITPASHNVVACCSKAI